MKTAGSELLQKTAEESFWTTYVEIPDPFDGLVWRRASTQKTDTFPRYGAAPMPEQWSGDRNAKVANEYSYTATNLPYDATIKIDKEAQHYDQLDNWQDLVRNLASKTMAHQTKVLTTLVSAGTSTVCEDGQFYFDVDHKDPGGEYTTNQDNDKAGTCVDATIPTDVEMLGHVRTAMTALWTFKDDRGDPVVPQTNAASDFILMVPPIYRSVGLQIQNNNQITGPIGNELQGQFSLRVNPFLSAEQFFLFYAGNSHFPLILQESKALHTTNWEDDTSGDFFYSAGWWGVEKYGQWRNAVSMTLTNA